MPLAQELQDRGFIYQLSTENLGKIFDGEKRTVYLGIDPTADSMHVGHLVPYMLLNHIINAGHHVIVLIGGGTALIGDPSFKESERDIANIEEIAEQCKKLEENIRKIITSNEIKFVNNYDWLSKLSAIEFLREVGKHFTINSMIKKESVSARLESVNGISFTEFSYTLLQSYDYYHLHKKYNCDVQIGGSDQWGNITSGIDYVRRMTGDTVYGITAPLVTDKATGKKFGKSEGNAIWLDAEKTSPYQFYQFWLNISDESVIEYLKLFTILSLSDIAEIENKFSQNPESRSAQKRLAYAVTEFVHGKNQAESIEKVSMLLFGEGEISLFGKTEKQILLQNAPTCKVKTGAELVDVLVESGLASSRREARTFIESGAVQISRTKIEDTEATIQPGMFVDGLAVLRRGKKNIYVLTLV